MVLEDVDLKQTPEAYFRWVASTPDGGVSTRGSTPASAVYHLHARLREDRNRAAEADAA